MVFYLKVTQAWILFFIFLIDIILFCATIWPVISIIIYYTRVVLVFIIMPWSISFRCFLVQEFRYILFHRNFCLHVPKPRYLNYTHAASSKYAFLMVYKGPSNEGTSGDYKRMFWIYMGWIHKLVAQLYVYHLRWHWLNWLLMN